MSVGNYPYGLLPIAYSATPTFDCSTANVFTMTLTGNITSMSVTNAIPGQNIVFMFTQDNSGLHSVAWPATFKGAISIPITALANTTAVQEVVFNGTNFYSMSIGQLNL